MGTATSALCFGACLPKGFFFGGGGEGVRSMLDPWYQDYDITDAAARLTRGVCVTNPFTQDNNKKNT